MYKPNLPTTPLADASAGCLLHVFDACGIKCPEQCIQDAVEAGVCPILESGDFEKLETDWEKPGTCQGELSCIIQVLVDTRIK